MRMACETYGAVAPGFRLQVHPAAKTWAPDGEVLARLRAAYPYPEVTVHLWPRHMADQVSGRPGASGRAFRALSRGDDAHVFVDATETPASVAWLIAHELGHHKAKREGLHGAFEIGRPRDLDGASDRFHEVDPEERWADGLATRLTGQRFDRAWWRARAPVGDAGAALLAHRYGAMAAPNDPTTLLSALDAEVRRLNGPPWPDWVGYDRGTWLVHWGGCVRRPHRFPASWHGRPVQDVPGGIMSVPPPPVYWTAQDLR